MGNIKKKQLLDAHLDLNPVGRPPSPREFSPPFLSHSLLERKLKKKLRLSSQEISPLEIRTLALIIFLLSSIFLRQFR